MSGQAEVPFDREAARKRLKSKVKDLKSERVGTKVPNIYNKAQAKSAMAEAIAVQNAMNKAATALKRGLPNSYESKEDDGESTQEALKSKIKANLPSKKDARAARNAAVFAADDAKKEAEAELEKMCEVLAGMNVSITKDELIQMARENKDIMGELMKKIEETQIEKSSIPVSQPVEVEPPKAIDNTISSSSTAINLDDVL
jgi:hypothetical protein